MDIARYLVYIDKDGEYFNQNIIDDDGQTFCEGNVRLNIVMHQAQNMYIGRTGNQLIDVDSYAYEYGTMFPNVYEQYDELLKTRDTAQIVIDDELQSFLCRVLLMLRNAPIMRLIEIDKQEPSWRERRHSFKAKRKMNPMKFADDYKVRYEGANRFLDEMINYEDFQKRRTVG